MWPFDFTESGEVLTVAVGVDNELVLPFFNMPIMLASDFGEAESSSAVSLSDTCKKNILLREFSFVHLNKCCRL